MYLSVFHLNSSLVSLTSVHKWFGLAGINSSAPSKRASTLLPLALIPMIKACVAALQLGKCMTCGHIVRWLLYASCITRPRRSSAEITGHQYRFFHHTILGCPLCIVYPLCVSMCLHACAVLFHHIFPQLECVHVDLHLFIIFVVLHSTAVRWKSYLCIWGFFVASWRITCSSTAWENALTSWGYKTHSKLCWIKSKLHCHWDKCVAVLLFCLWDARFSPHNRLVFVCASAIQYEEL